MKMKKGKGCKCASVNQKGAIYSIQQDNGMGAGKMSMTNSIQNDKGSMGGGSSKMPFG